MDFIDTIYNKAHPTECSRPPRSASLIPEDFQSRELWLAGVRDETKEVARVLQYWNIRQNVSDLQPKLDDWGGETPVVQNLPEREENVSLESSMRSVALQTS